MQHFQRRVHHFRVGEKSFEGFGVGTFFAGGGGNRPAAEGIEAPGADEILISLRRIGGQQGVPCRHVAIGDGAECGRPLIIVGGFDVGEGFADVGGIEADEGIHSVFGAFDSFGFNFVKGAFFLWLLGAGAGCQRDQD